MVNPNVLKGRIEKASEYIALLKSIKENHSPGSFLTEPLVYGSAERFLHLSIEALLDIGNHIIADEELGRVDRYGDIPRILAKRGYLDPEMERIFIRIVGFRNILVHDYTRIDHGLVYEILRDNLPDLEAILAKMSVLL